MGFITIVGKLEVVTLLRVCASSLKSSSVSWRVAGWSCGRWVLFVREELYFFPFLLFPFYLPPFNSIPEIEPKELYNR